MCACVKGGRAASVCIYMLFEFKGMTLNQLNVVLSKQRRQAVSSRLVLTLLMAAVGLAACGDKEKKSGQALASVGGEEVTISQLNEELQRSGAPPAQHEQAKKQLLESLIDRQLLLNEAVKEKIDRDPNVVQGIERAKALIIAQAYMQKHIGTVAKPSAAEVQDYFTKNPIFFSQRKQLEMRQLVLATSDISDELKATMDSAKSLEEVAGWLDSHKVKYARAQQVRSTTELPPELTTKLLAMPKGQLFVIKEGERSVLVTITDTRDAPVTLEQAAPQIEQLLFAQRNKAAGTAELARLRAAAKIEYLNKEVAPKAAPAAAPAAPAAAKEAEGSTERGVAGLK